jgi:hypothetical protein
LTTILQDVRPPSSRVPFSNVSCEH